jgi:uncharacterized protein YkwD
LNSGHGAVKLTRTALAAALLAAAACRSPQPTDSAARPLRIVEPPHGKALSETYPPASLPSDDVKRAVFDQINRDRAAHGLPPVAWDESASRVADLFCTRQVAEKTRGHYASDGIPPYARTGFAGVFGYQSENAASWSTTASTFSQTPMGLALAAQQSMMDEVPPDDGHRRSILDPEATHVGVGWSMTGGRFQMAEEFLVRGLESLTIKSGASPAVVRFSGAARSPLRLVFVTIAREPPPVPLTKAEANSRTSYRYPIASLAYVPEGHRSFRVVDTVTQDRIRFGRDRDFSFTFAPPDPGLWTFAFWVVDTGESQPKPGGSAVIRVEP